MLSSVFLKPLKKIVVGLAVISLLPVFMLPSASLAAELSFTLDEIEIPKGVAVRILPLPFSEGVKPGFILIESGEDVRFLSRYSVGDELVRDFRIQIEPEIQFFDIARLGTQYQLVAYRNPSLLVLNQESHQFELLLNIESFFRGTVKNEINNVEIVRDVNADDLDDVMIPDFEGWQVSLQKPDGSFTHPQLIGPPPVMSTGSARYVGFSAQDAFFMDHNADGRDDLAFWDNGEFLVHYRDDDNHYSEQAIVFKTNIDGISKDGSLSMGVGGPADNSEREEKILSAIEDLNGDGIADLLIQAFEVDGLFSTKTRFDIHLGIIGSEGLLTYPSEPDSTVLSDGIQFGAERLDIDDNGTAEMMVLSVKFTIGTVIRALLARTVGLTIGIYQMTDNRYPEHPNITRKVTVKLDFTKGEISIPAIFVADVTGDGLTDLLVQDGDDEVDVFPGNGTSSLFDSRPIQIPLSLPDMQPELGKTIQAEDLDGDGRDELLIVLEFEDAPTKIITAHFHSAPKFRVSVK